MNRKQKDMENKNTRIVGVHLNNCKFAVITNNGTKNNHSNLTIRDVTRAPDGKARLSISNTKGVTLDNIRIPDEDISIKNCSEVTYCSHKKE